MSTNAKPEIDEAPSVGGVRVRPSWSVVLYALLVLSAGLALYAQRAQAVDPLLSQAAPWLFLVFAAGFAVYRVSLVAARKYSPFKAFIQVFLAALFFLLLLFPRQAPVAQATLLQHREDRVRAVAAEVIGWRGETTQGPALVKLLDDRSAEVKDAAHAALVRLNGGVDLGPTAEAWRALFP